MQRHFEKELESLRIMLIKMGSVVEEALRLSLASFHGKHPEAAQEVLKGEDRINALEVEIDNAIVDLLALQQPVAVDLRFILAAQKINNDLERLGDHAVNIAQSALALATQPACEPLPQLEPMGTKAQQMLREALDAFIHSDARMGSAVLTHDDAIDDLNKRAVREVIERMKKNPHLIETGMELIRVSRNLERVADLATNIAEEVIFIAQARIVKHHAAERSAEGNRGAG